MMTKTKTVKARTEKPALKVMHYIRKDENGNTIYSSKTLQEQPKLREAVGSDVVQQAEETGHKVSKAKLSKPGKTEKLKDEMTDEQLSVLKALDSLGGKDVHSMDIAKNLGFDKTHKNAPRAPVRNAMDRLHELHFVTFEKKGIKYSYSITDKGGAALHKDKTDPNDSNASAPSSPSNSRGIECPACKTENPPIAVHCKNCGTELKAVQAVAVAA